MKVVPAKETKKEGVVRYLRQTELRKLYNFSHRDMMNLEAAGLRRIKLGANTRVVLYDLENLDEVMARLAI